MNRIQHIIEPNRVWLVWQSNSPGQTRSRRFVGEVRNAVEGKGITFSYLEGTDDFNLAKAEGFDGFPAFKMNSQDHSQGVLEAFMRRLPPRNREDFNEYLERHRLPENFNYSDLALLAYTGAKLPSDSFEFCADLIDATPPLEMVMEIAGFRHHNGCSSSELVLGDVVTFIPEPQNQFDPEAVAIMYKNHCIGYVGRTYTRSINHWLSMDYTIEAIIERINGKPERPLIYLYVTVQ